MAVSYGLHQTFIASFGLNTSKFKYQLNDDKLILQGVYKDDTLSVQLEYYDKNNFVLLNRGFNWINEFPYNRFETGGINP